ncbi:MAG: serine protease [Deltaproteobacteria bacterium]|nr:serine protease [Deltaproteobacteria bacterium]
MKRYELSGIFVHPKWNPETLEYDAALLKLKTSLPYTPIRPASALETALYAAQSTATVIGWGMTNPYYQILPDILQEGDVPIVSDEDCAARNGRWFIKESMVCADALTTNYDDLATSSCYGDSGGPLLVHSGAEPVQVGIVSWGFECSSTNTHGVYSRVSAMSDFINSRPVASHHLSRS